MGTFLGVLLGLLGFNDKGKKYLNKIKKDITDDIEKLKLSFNDKTDEGKITDGFEYLGYRISSDLVSVRKSSILKIAHHGSKTSSSEEFLEAVKPEIALIGVGKNNKFGHPNKEIIKKQRAGALCYLSSNGT